MFIWAKLRNGSALERKPRRTASRSNLAEMKPPGFGRIGWVEDGRGDLVSLQRQEDDGLLDVGAT
jgi:hypothetical protein